MDMNPREISFGFLCIAEKQKGRDYQIESSGATEGRFFQEINQPGIDISLKIFTYHS
jgi:hypothetical protein